MESSAARWFWPPGLHQVKPAFPSKAQCEKLGNSDIRIEDHSMMIRPLLVLSAMLFLAAPLAAADCPVARSRDAISDTLEKAPSCAAAQKLFEACA
jgi:hypothetical protein